MPSEEVTRLIRTTNAAKEWEEVLGKDLKNLIIRGKPPKGSTEVNWKDGKMIHRWNLNR